MVRTGLAPYKCSSVALNGEILERLNLLLQGHLKLWFSQLFGNYFVCTQYLSLTSFTMLKIKPLYLVVIVLITAFATWKLTLRSRYPSASITLLTVKRLDSSLNATNEIIRQSNRQIISGFDQNLKKPETVEKAKIWSPIMHAAIAHTDKMVLQIDALKTQLKKEAGLAFYDGEERYHEDDIDAATRLMLHQGEGKKLMDSLQAFYTNVLSLISKERREKISELPVQRLLNQPIESYFKATPAIAGIALLTKFQNDVLRSGNIVADFCSFQVATYSDNYLDKFATLVSQNSTHLLKGETLEVKAGLGAFSTASNPIITINGQRQIVNENGFASYKIAVGEKDDRIPVSISFKNPNTGEPVTKTMYVSYTVGKQ
jgi:hypothetical protein